MTDILTPQESFAPQVVVDGHTVTPEGWMWVLAFAIRGVPWAVKAAEAMDMDAKVADFRRRQRIAALREQIAHHEQSLERLRAELESQTP